MEGIRKYEFENRSSGGVVGFKDYEAAKNHQKERRRIGNSAGAGGCLMFVGLIVMLIVFMAGSRL